MITLTEEQLEELIGAVTQGISMMEPYYTQCGAGDDLQAIADKYQDLLPYPEKVIPPLACPECGKPFSDVGALSMHMDGKHQWAPRRRKDLRQSLEPHIRVWPNKAAYLQHVAGTTT